MAPTPFEVDMTFFQKTIFCLVAAFVTWSTPCFALQRVVATLPDLAAVASEVGGEHVKVTAMALPTQDPHFVDAKPSLVLEVSRADLLLLAGLDLEIGWLPTLLTGSRNPKIQKGNSGYLDCSQFIHVLEVPTQVVDRSMGDLHPGGNPHYYYDPRAISDIANGIAERLSTIDPEHASDFVANAKIFTTTLSGAIERWEADFEAANKVPVIQYHRSWPYFADFAGLELISDVEPKPGIPPAPAQVAHVVNLARERQVKIILIESYYPSSTARLVAEKAGATLVVLPAGTNFNGGQSYIEHIDEWTKEFQAALGGQ
jgi:zinc/manganese transport system substrate-binding protein